MFGWAAREACPRSTSLMDTAGAASQCRGTCLFGDPRRIGNLSKTLVIGLGHGSLGRGRLQVPSQCGHRIRVVQRSRQFVSSPRNRGARCKSEYNAEEEKHRRQDLGFLKQQDSRWHKLLSLLDGHRQNGCRTVNPIAKAIPWLSVDDIVCRGSAREVARLAQVQVRELGPMHFKVGHRTDSQERRTYETIGDLSGAHPRMESTEAPDRSKPPAWFNSVRGLRIRAMRTLIARHRCLR